MTRSFSRFFAAGILGAALLAPTASAQVHSTVFFGNLLVWGTNAAESLTMTGTGGTLSVIGNAGTTVNGQPSVTYTNITGGVLVAMCGGNDQLFISDAEVNCALFVDMGAGDDLVFAARNRIHGHFVVDGGCSGPNGELIALSDGDGVGNTVDGTLAVGAQFATVIVRGSQVGRDILVCTGCGNDLVKVDGCVVGDDVLIDTDGGNDDVEVGSIAPAVGNLIHGSLVVHAGCGSDTVRVGSLVGGASTVEDCSEILAESGNDLLQIRNTTFARHLTARGAMGNDVGELQNVAFANHFDGGLFVDGFDSLQ